VLRKYRVVPLGSSADDEWYDDQPSASRALGRWTGIPESDIEARAKRVSLDPVVVRRPDGRWRSTTAWSYRGPTGAARLFEMLLVDEAKYDH
jgi:hypothetical protein